MAKELIGFTTSGAELTGTEKQVAEAINKLGTGPQALSDIQEMTGLSEWPSG